MNHSEPYKLRTMVSSHVHDPNETVPITHSAITPVGYLLRRLKIDELPQFYNVVNGEMALLGPRSTLIEQTAEYDEIQRPTLDVRPGMTGLTQVNGNTALSWAERIKYDTYYVAHHGLWMDLSILLKTIPVIILDEEYFARPFEQSPYASSL
jgi:lipopolysaccharide/colanic/teichoic acid biosynthesis glycosyltransferase